MRSRPNKSVSCLLLSGDGVLAICSIPAAHSAVSLDELLPKSNSSMHAPKSVGWTQVHAGHPTEEYPEL